MMKKLDVMTSDERKCVNCHRCVSLVPDAGAENRKERTTPFRKTPTGPARPSTRSTARPERGGVLLSSMGNPQALSGLLG